MTISDRVYLFNQWYDRLPQQQQFLAAWWTAWGAMLVTLMFVFFLGFPFWLVAGVIFLFFMLPRILFKFDMIDRAKHLPARDEGGETKIAVQAPLWVYDANAWFDAQPEPMRVVWVAAATMAAFAASLILHWLIRLPVGLVPGLAVLVLGWARVLQTQGWLAPRPGPELGLHAPALAGETARIGETAKAELAP